MQLHSVKRIAEHLAPRFDDFGYHLEYWSTAECKMGIFPYREQRNSSFVGEKIRKLAYHITYNTLDYITWRYVYVTLHIVVLIIK